MKKLLLSVFMVLLALPAFAAINIYNTPEGDKVDIYGSIRLTGGYQNSQGFTAGSWVAKKSDLDYRMLAASNFGVSFKVDKFFGAAEVNFNMDGVTGGFGFRQLYGGYDFGGGHKLSMGQQWALTGSHRDFKDYWMNNNFFTGFGVLYTVRRPMIKYNYYGLGIAVIVNTDAVDKFATTAPNVSGYKQGPVYIPRFEIAYNFSSGNNFKGKVGATYGLFTEKSQADGSYENINAFHVELALNPKFGAGAMNASVFYSMNGAMYGAVRSLQMSNGFTGADDVMPTIAGGKVNDVQSWGIALNGSYNFNEVVGAVLGVGWQMNMSDRYKADINDGKSHDLDSWGVYAQVPFKLNKYMQIVPSVGYYSSFYSNTGKASRKDINTLLAGAFFLTNF